MHFLKTKTIRILAGTFFACATAIGVFLFLLISIGREMDAHQELQGKVALAEIRESKLEQLHESVRAITADRDLLDSYFLREEEIVSFLETIESLAYDPGTDVAVTSVDQGNTAQGGNFTTLNLSIDVQGPWVAVFLEFSLIETLPVPLVVHQATIDVINAQGDDRTWKGSFRVSVLQQ